LADQTTIDTVKSYLPSWTEELTNWDDAKISSILDSNGNAVLVTVYMFWLQRVGDLSALTDVTDAGASRPLSQTYQHAQDMLHYWDAVSGQNATSVGKIKRRYPVRHGRRGVPPYGLQPYGGVYVRTD
jgi:hypothetical protein